MSAPFGTVAWAQAGGGRMTRAETVREIVRSSAVVLRWLPARGRQRLGLDSPRAFALDVERIAIPDSRIAREAEEECREASPERLLHHCLRTYVWGMMLGAREGLDPDPELLYVGCMLHDLALTDRHRDHAPMPCFAARGGLLARDWAGLRGWPAERCTTLGDTISLHLNAAVAPEHGPEARLLQAGAGLDVIGLRSHELSRATRAGVLARYPFGDFLEGMPDFEAEAHPGTRAGLLMRRLGFGLLARHSPVER